MLPQGDAGTGAVAPRAPRGAIASHALASDGERRIAPARCARFFTSTSLEDPMQTTSIRHDTRAWKTQVWVSFCAAAFLCAVGLAWLPGRDLDRAFMVMGYMFCLSSAFALAKFIRDNAARPVDTPLWRLVVWGGFLLAMALTGWGLVQMEINPAYRAFLGVSWLFLISSCFTLAKTLRDAHENLLAETAQTRLSVCASCERG
jgi:hypothetical protein